VPGSEPDELGRTAARLCTAAERVLEQAPSRVSGADWDPTEEEPLSETAHWADQFRRWERTGEHPYLSLRPGLEPGAALADSLLQALDGVLSRPEDYGLDIDASFRREVEGVMAEYLRLRKTGVGGPGGVNAELWQR
jgi:hypothetical protein